MTKLLHSLFSYRTLKLTLGLFGVLVITLPTLFISSITPASAGDSANFKVRNDQIGNTPTSQSSPNYRVNGSIEEIVGSQTGGTTRTQLGAPTNPGTASVPPVTPGGGGSVTADPNNCPDPGQIRLLGISCTLVYKGLLKIKGTRSANTPYILVNEDMSGVHLSSPTTWEKDIMLRTGENTIVIYGKNACEERTPPITIVFTRNRMGDINDDTQTNDYDLSTFTRRWERRNDCPSDFNRDLLTDDYDLSLLASSWTG